MSPPSQASQRRSDDLHAHLLTTAGQLFYRKGIRAAGIDELVTVAGVAKATLYRHFASKEALVVAYLEDRKERLSSAMTASVDWSSPPSVRVVAAFAALDEKFAAPDFRGCAFLLAASEFGDVPAICDVVRSYKAFVRQHFAKLLGSSAPARLADQLSLIYEGALATAVVQPDAGAGQLALACASALLRDAGILSSVPSHNRIAS